jgi:hypothetical protein
VRQKVSMWSKSKRCPRAVHQPSRKMPYRGMRLRSAQEVAVGMITRIRALESTQCEAGNDCDGWSGQKRKANQVDSREGAEEESQSQRLRVCLSGSWGR